MIHLAEATRITRIFLKFTALTIGGLFSLFVLYHITLFIKSIFFPPPPPPIGQKFGELPSLEFPQSSSTITYKINTLNGSLPVFPDRMKVYKTEAKDPNLLNLKNIRGTVRSVSYMENEVKLGKTTYQWTNNSPPQRFIRIDTVTRNFEVASNYLTDPNVLAAKYIPNDKDARRQVTNFIARLGEKTDDIDQNNMPITYYKIVNRTLVRADSLSEAQVVRVDLFQKPVNTFEIYYSYTYFNESPMRFFIGSGPDGPEIVEASFNHQTPDLSVFSEYPMVTSKKAFDDLKAGKAYVFNPEGKQTIDITEVKPGYFLKEAETEYLIPIIVFKGKNFKAYVQALKSN